MKQPFPCSNCSKKLDDSRDIIYGYSQIEVRKCLSIDTETGTSTLDRNVECLTNFHLPFCDEDCFIQHIFKTIKNRGGVNTLLNDAVKTVLSSN